MSRWFRLYAEFATDPKVQMLSEADQRRYVMLLCLRCGNGDVTLHDDEIAFQLRISDAEWAETKATLQARGLIDDEGKPSAWDKRQFISDSSKSRVSAYRERKKQEAKRECNVTVTPPDTDTDTDTDTDISPKPPSGGFDEFWKACPRKIGKGQAQRAWRAAVKKTPAEEIVAALEVQAKRWQQEGRAREFIPHPATWLNGERWADEIEQAEDWRRVFENAD